MSRAGGPSGRKRGFFNGDGAAEFFLHLMVDKPLLPFLIPLVLIAWSIERWVFSFSNWVPLAVAVWATLQVFASFSLHFVAAFIDLFLICSSHLDSVFAIFEMHFTVFLNFLCLPI